MPAATSFPDAEPQYDSDRDCLAFRAITDGKAITCLVTAEFLMAHCGARDWTEASLREAFRDHTADIQALAREQVENGWIDELGRTVLTKRFTRLKVTFSERLEQWSAGRALVDTAHRVLLNLIGPYAGEIAVEWDGGEDAPGRSVIRLRISDRSIPYSVAGTFAVKEVEKSTRFRGDLAGLWMAILQVRSQELILKSG